jgi:hypothetical protein
MKSNFRKQSPKFLQTYIYNKDKTYFVSTAYRQSSAMINTPPWYFETIAWEINEKNEREKMVEMVDSGSGENIAFKSHFDIVKKLTTP